MIHVESDRQTAAAESYQWALLSFTGTAELDVSILTELSDFRGRVLYAEGRRPRFRKPHGRHADDDPLDSRSLHVTARRGSDLVGCIRIRPFGEHSRSCLGNLVDEHQFEAILAEMALTRNDCLEVSRWIVAPEARGTALGRTLVVSAWAVGISLGKRGLLASVGLRDGQATMLTRFGGQFVPGVPSKFVTEYDDEVALMHFDLTCPPPRVAARLDAVRRLLHLPDSRCWQSGQDHDCCFSASNDPL